jgi:hypothetical protein
LPAYWIGIPTSLILKFFNAETARMYQVIGGMGGLILPLLIIGETTGIWMCFLGAFAGVITAHTWWQSMLFRGNFHPAIVAVPEANSPP